MLKFKLGRYFRKDNYTNFVQLGIIYAIFTISFVARYVFNYWFVIHYGITRKFTDYGFCMETYPYISSQGFYWEAYHDASQYYQYYIYAFRFQNWDLYSFQPWPLSGYVYGPLFAFFLVLTSYFIQLFNPHMTIARISWEAVKISPMIFDSITTIFVYLIIKELVQKRLGKNTTKTHLYSFFGSMIFLILPTVFFYNDVLYLNTYMFMCFNIIALYFMIKRSYKLAGAFLASAILTKLVALFFLPLWLVFLFRSNKKNFWEFISGVLIVGIIISLPWILLYPSRFFSQQLWTGEPFNTRFSIDPVWILWSTTPFHVFLFWDKGQNGFWYKIAFVYYILNNHYIPLLAFHILCYISMLLIGSHLYKHSDSFVLYQAMFAIGIHLFLSRGNYKYYDPFFMPFVIIAIFVWAQRFNDIRVRVGVLLGSITWVFIVNIWILVNIKWLHMFYVFLLFVTMLSTFDTTMHKCFIDRDNYRSLFKFATETAQELIQIYRQLVQKSKLLFFRSAEESTIAAHTTTKTKEDK